MPRIRAQKTKPQPEPIPDDESIEESASTVAVVDDEPAIAVIDEPEPEPEPPKVKAPPPPASDLIRDEVERERRLAECREQLYFRRHELLADGGELSPAEMRIVWTAIPRMSGESDFAYRERVATFLYREETRVTRILDLQAAAGSVADRAAADELAETTQARLDAEGPGLLAEIERLQSHLMGLHQAADSARSAADARHQAVANLRRDDLVPAFLRDEISAARRESKKDFGIELQKLESRRRQILGALDIDCETKEGCKLIEHIVAPHNGLDDRGFRELEEFFVCEWVQAGAHRAFRVGKIREDRWNEFCASLREELDSIERRILEITNGEKAEADVRIEQMRSYYIPK